MTTATDNAVLDQLAGDIRRAVYLAAASVVTPERKLGYVLERLSVVETLFDDLAAWIADGRHRPYRVRD